MERASFSLLVVVFMSLLFGGRPATSQPALAAETALTSLVDELLRLSAVAAASASSQQNQSAHLHQTITPDNSNGSSKKQILNQANPIRLDTTSRPLQRVNSSLSIARQRWRQMEQSVAVKLGATSGQWRQKLEELLLAAPAVSLECRSKLEELLEALGTQRFWASSMIDASARLPTGLLEGTLTELGNFDQCLGLGSGSSLDSVQPQSQYCSLQVRPPLPQRARHHTICQRLAPLSNSLTNASSGPHRLFRQLAQNSHLFHYASLRLGLCAPSRCSRQDLQHLLSAYLAPYELVGQVRACQLASDELKGVKLDGLQQCLVAAFVVLLSLILVGTLIDFVSSSKVGRNNNLTKGQVQQTIGGEFRAKRWHHYQVHQGDLLAANGGNCFHHHHHHHQPGVQRNPLLVVTSGTQTMRRQSPQSTDNNLEDEATWISQLEREHFTLNIDEKRRHQNKPLLVSQLFTCFSLRLSLRTIGRSSQSEQHQDNGLANVQVVHGFRTLTMIWIIFAHTLGLVNPEMLNNLFSMAQLSCQSRLLQALLNATLAVNSFFMISGFVTALSLGRKCKSSLARVWANQDDDDDGREKQQMEKQSPKKASVLRHVTPNNKSKQVPTSSTTNNLVHDLSSVDSSSSIISPPSFDGYSVVWQQQQQKSSGGCKGQVKKKEEEEEEENKNWPSDFKPLLWLAMRYLRLTPTYGATVALAILLPSLGSGPFWQESVASIGAQCRDNWWTNLLYANNFINTPQLCLIHSWYLSNDYQFFLLALILLWLFYRSKRLTTCLLLILILSTSAATFVLTVANDLAPTIVSTSPAISERWFFIHSLYYKPWPHLGSYLIGLIAGYLLILSTFHGGSSRKPSRISSSGRRWCWLVFSLMALALLNSIYPWNLGFQVDPTLAGLHAATFRTLWAICCAWFLYALATKPSSWLAKLLSWHGFQVTSRLTYCAYLIHPLIIYYHFGMLRERLDSSVYGQTQRFLSTLASTYLFALLLALLVEAPLARLQTLLFKTFQSDISSEEEEEGEEDFKSTTKASSKKKNESFGGGEQLKTNQTSEVNSSATSSTGSWAGTSSFGDQNSALISNPLGSFGPKDLAPPESSLSGQLNQSPVSSNISAPANVPSQNFIGASQSQVEPNEENLAAALDVDFQRKLAQAIGRGFRIRSRLAASSSNSNTNISNSGAILAAPATLNSGNVNLNRPAGKKQQQQVNSKRSPIQPLERITCYQSNQAATLSSAQALVQRQVQRQRPAASARRVEFSTFFAQQQVHQHQHQHSAPVRSPSSNSCATVGKQAELLNSSPMAANDVGK